MYFPLSFSPGFSVFMPPAAENTRPALLPRTGLLFSPVAILKSENRKPAASFIALPAAGTGHGLCLKQENGFIF
jgi:hypothetical protein